MADSERENQLGFADKRRLGGATTRPAGSASANYNDVSTLRARLTAISATTFTVARLNAMTKNDMMYAVRLTDDAAGI